MNTKRIFLSAIIAALPFTANATQTIVTAQTPAAVGANGTVSMAATSGPYVTNEPTVADQTHIATTAYVKGAYNDAIAAVNKVDSQLDNKQGKLINATNNHDMGTNVMTGANYDSFLTVLGNSDISDEEYSGAVGDIAQDLGVQNLDDVLISAGTVMNGIKELSRTKQWKLDPIGDSEYISTDVVSSDYLDSLQSIAITNIDEMDDLRAEVEDYGGDSADNMLITTDAVLKLIQATSSQLQNDTNSKRVRIYTTWGTDTAAATTLVPFEMAQ